MIGGCTMGATEYKEKILNLINECNNLHWLKCIYAYVKKLIE